MAACEGALLVVDATQGVEAQTMANVYLALDNNLEIVPVINKIDLASADVNKVRDEVEQTIGLDCSAAIPCSAKTGQGIEDILESIVHHLPPPRNADDNQPLRALIFDSYYDPFRGVVVFFRLMQGNVKRGDIIRFINSNSEFEVLEVGFMTPEQVRTDVVRAGEVGFLSANIKGIDQARVGDTFTLSKYIDQVSPLPGYEPAKQMVFAGLYPTDSDQYEAMRDALGKLKLNDASFSFSPEASSSMGFGFRCGFLGLLHMDIIQERLEREYDIDLIVTAPSVVYKIILNGPDKKEVLIDTPSKMPDPASFQDILEPYVRLEMISPAEYTGSLMDLAVNRRGVFMEMKYLTPTRTALVYEVSEIIFFS